MNFNGQRLFGTIEEREMSLFVTLTYSDLIKSEDILVFNNQKFYLLNEFVFVAFKNAHHDQLVTFIQIFNLKNLNQGLM